MSEPIFLSYRQSDSASVARRLYDAIQSRFGEGSVYLDKSSIAWGEDWPTALEKAIGDADVVLVVIGPDWIRASDEWGIRRIDQPDDWARRELEFAFGSSKTVLPLLVGGAQMPPEAALPPQIRKLASIHGFRLDEEAWEQQIRALLDRLASHIGGRPTPDGRPGAAPLTERIRQEFRAAASRFSAAPLQERMAAASKIAGVGSLLDLDEVLAFARSKEHGERVGAAIAIGAHLRESERPREYVGVQSALRALLNDDRARVRYRAAEVLRGVPALVPAYERDLRWHAESDRDSEVRRMSRQALRRAGRA